MVVVNISGKDLKIKELRQTVPADGKKYILPYNIAIRYKKYLKPVQLSDSPPEEYNKPMKQESDKTIDKVEVNKESPKTENKVETKTEQKPISKEESNKETNLNLENVTDKKEAVLNIYKEGLVKTKKEIAKLTGVKYQSVVYYIKEYEKKKNKK